MLITNYCGMFTNKTRLKDIDNNDDNYKKIIVKWGRTTDTDMVILCLNILR